MEHRTLDGHIGVLGIILPHADGGQGLVAEHEGVALPRRDERLLGVRVRFGEALQRLQLLYPEPAVPQAQGAHLGAVQLNAAILVRVENAQVIHFAGGRVVAGIPNLEGDVSQPLKRNGVLLDDFDDRALVVLEVCGVVPVRVQRHQLGRSIHQPGRRDRLFGNFVYSRQQILQDGAACGVRFDFVYGVAVRRPDRENGVLNRLPGVGVIFIDDEVGPLVVFQHDGAGFPRKQLHMMFSQAQNVIVFGGRFYQGIHARLQPLPQNFACGRGDAVQIMRAVLDLRQPEGDPLQRGAV